MVITQGNYRALPTVHGACVTCAALSGLGIGAIIRHSAGAIPTFTESTGRLVAAPRDVVEGPSRFRPEVIYGRAASVTVPSVLSAPDGGALSGAIRPWRKAAPVAFSMGGAVLDRRCP